MQASAQRRSIKRLHNPCQWISIFPQHKERVDTASHFSVQLTTSFSPHLLARLNRKPQVDDFLIVRCLNGNDSFATIGCKYKPSIIGFSLKALATLDAQTTFEQCDREHLVERFERDIAAFEQQLGLLVSNFVRDYSNQLQKFNAEKLLAEVSSGNSGSSNAKLKQSSSSSWSVPNNMATIESVAQSRLDMYKNCLLEMRNEIVDNDPHFHLPLSPEYTFLLQHLTDRCYKILNTSDDNQPQQQQQPQPAQQELLVDIGDRSSVPLATWPARATSSNALAIEEQKSMVLRLLSTRSFNEFEQGTQCCLKRILFQVYIAIFVTQNCQTKPTSTWSCSPRCSTICSWHCHSRSCRVASSTCARTRRRAASTSRLSTCSPICRALTCNSFT